jgi:hypothetical protein
VFITTVVFNNISYIYKRPITITGVNLWRSNGLNYLAKLQRWIDHPLSTAHAQPARLLPDGFGSLSRDVDENESAKNNHPKQAMTMLVDEAKICSSKQ